EGCGAGAQTITPTPPPESFPPGNASRGPAVRDRVVDPAVIDNLLRILLRQEVAQASGRAAELPPAAPEEGEPETLADGIHPTAGPLLSDPPNLPGWTRWLESAPWVFGTGSSLVLGWLAVGAV